MPLLACNNLRPTMGSLPVLPLLLLLSAAASGTGSEPGTSRAERGPDNVTTALLPGGGPPGSGPPRRTPCGGDRAAHLSECLAQLPEILQKAEGVGIPSSKKDLDAYCSAFKTGMGCVETYSRECMSPKDRRLLEEQVAGANYTFRFLCDDKVFQAEYLQYTSCYRGITRDWDSCANRFMQLVREEMTRKNASDQSRTLELCCAKYGFLKCVYVASRVICRKEEAMFLNRIAETLSSMRVYSLVCRDLDVAVCSAGAARPRRPPPPLPLLALLLFLLLLPPSQWPPTRLRRMGTAERTDCCGRVSTRRATMTTMCGLALQKAH